MTSATSLETTTHRAGGPAAAVLGDGLLHAAINRTLAGDARGPVDVDHATALVLATDTWDTSRHEEARHAARAHSIPWLPARVELGTAVIGPTELPGGSGCANCAELRRRRARTDTAGRDAVMREYGALLAQRPSAWLTSLGADTVAAIVADEIARLAENPAGGRTRHAVLHVELDTLTVTRHRFLPEPLCPICGDLPDDSAERAAITLDARPKPTPTTYRVRAVVDELERLVDTYVDGETGLIRSLHRDTQGGLVIAGAMLPIRSHNAYEPGVGRGRSYRTSVLTAILEALERYGGTEPGGKRTVVEASFAELGGAALDPRSLGVHPESSYRLPDFPYRRFTEDTVCRWVWGYSFAKGAPVLVPETVAYYHVRHRNPGDRAFLYEISNGCALGSCLEEAVLHGILEAAERDAFLMTWYASLPVPRIDLATARDREIPMQVEAIRAETGYQIHAFDTTMEHGIPCVWAMAVNQDDSDPRPAMICAAGSHLSRERAVRNALSELGPILADFIRRFPDEADRAHRMVDDPTLVATMPDHSTLYGARRAADRLGFLLGTPATCSLATPAPAEAAFRHQDLSDDLREVIGRYVRAGNDVVVVDQTTPEHRAGGFCCVKVLVPGLLPMTFGYHNRRIDGLPRLRTVPQRLGHRSGPLGEDDINPHPHPFP